MLTPEEESDEGVMAEELELGALIDTREGEARRRDERVDCEM